MLVNLKSAFLCTQAVLPGMRAKKWGRIVNISSGAARGAGAIGPHYNASKAGMEGLTRGYAARLVKEGITVNAVAPSLIETDMMKGQPQLVSRIPLGRFGQPGGSRASRDDADRQSLHDRPDDRDERRHGVQLGLRRQIAARQQMLAHHLARAVQAALHGIDRDLQVLGRLRRGQLVDVAQDQHLAVDRRQRRDRGGEILAQFDRQRLLLQHLVQSESSSACNRLRTRNRR